VPDELELVFVVGFADVPGVKDAEAVHLEDKSRPLQAQAVIRKAPLVDGDIVDQNIPEGVIHRIPFILPSLSPGE